MAHALGAEVGTPADAALVQISLDTLEDAHLIEDRGGAPRLSRRELVRRLGLAGAALVPIVVSLAVPTPAQAAATCVVDCSIDPFGDEGKNCGPPTCINTCQSGLCLP